MRALLITLFVLAPALSAAQGFGTRDRAQQWDFALGAIFQTSDRVDGQNGSYLDVKNAWGFGFNIGYHFNSRFSLSADLDFIRPDYTVEIISEDPRNQPVRVDHRLSQFNGRFKGTWNILDGPLVPYVEAGAGWTYIDSNVADGPPQTGCWWHPWWGYICSNYWSTFSSTETTYGGGLGIRYELRGGAFAKLSYNYWKLDSGGNSSDFNLASARLEYGWNF
jgi:opacity protein-like surface antigen